MEQVPLNYSDPAYLVIGNGRLAGHFLHYFDLLGIRWYQCTRQNLQEFYDLINTSDHDRRISRVLLLIRDDQIAGFVREYKPQAPSEVIWIHCSGVLSIDDAESAHPLASFSEVMFTDDFYQSIPFVTEKGRPGFNTLFPGLPNPNFEITKEQKTLYHAMCSVSGNFTTMLWQHFFNYLKHDLGFPEHMAFPFLESIAKNLVLSEDPLTGPIKRGDAKTVERHLDALKNTSLERVYRAFINFYKDSKL